MSEKITPIRPGVVVKPEEKKEHDEAHQERIKEAAAGFKQAVDDGEVVGFVAVAIYRGDDRNGLFIATDDVARANFGMEMIKAILINSALNNASGL